MSGTLEQQLVKIAQRAQGSDEIPAAVLTAVRRRQTHTRLAATGAMLATAAVVVGVAVAGVTLNRHHTSTKASTSHNSDATADSPSPTASPRPTFAPLTPQVPADHGEPAHFFASIGAGAERLAIVDTATGTITKYLQNTGSQALVFFNGDLSIGYQPTTGECDYRWVAINTTTGETSPAFTDLGKPLEVAVTTTGDRVAYVHVGPQQKITTPDGRTMNAGCPTATQTLVILDRTSGTRVQYALPQHDDYALFLAWDPTGTKLAFVLHGRVQILDINADTDLSQARPLSDKLQHGCTQVRPIWQPNTNTVLVNQMCGQRAAIVGYDAATGQRTYEHQVLGGSPFFTFDVDATGKHLIYANSGNFGGAQGEVYAVEPGGDRHILDGTYGVAW
jgi:hypothetical protein